MKPFLQGALIYSFYWGVMGIFRPYLNIYLLNIGINGKQLGILGAIFPFYELNNGPAFSIAS